MEKLKAAIEITALSILALRILHYSGLLLGHKYSGQSYFLGDLLVSCLALLLISIHCSKGFEVFRRPKLTWKLALCIGIGILVFFLNNGGLLLHPQGFQRSLGALITLLGIGVGEEFFSRGFVFRYLQEFGIWQAAIYSSIGFGLMHVFNYGEGQGAIATTLQVMNATAWGIIACGMVLLTSSIWPAVLLHAFNDSMIYFSVIPIHPVVERSMSNLAILFEGFVISSVLASIGLTMIAISGRVHMKARPVGSFISSSRELGLKFGLLQAEESS